MHQCRSCLAVPAVSVPLHSPMSYRCLPRRQSNHSALPERLFNAPGKPSLQHRDQHSVTEADIEARIGRDVRGGSTTSCIYALARQASNPTSLLTPARRALMSEFRQPKRAVRHNPGSRRRRRRAGVRLLDARTPTLAARVLQRGDGVAVTSASSTCVPLRNRQSLGCNIDLIEKCWTTPSPFVAAKMQSDMVWRMSFM